MGVWVCVFGCGYAVIPFLFASSDEEDGPVIVEPYSGFDTSSSKIQKIDSTNIFCYVNKVLLHTGL